MKESDADKVCVHIPPELQFYAVLCMTGLIAARTKRQNQASASLIDRYALVKIHAGKRSTEKQ